MSLPLILNGKGTLYHKKSSKESELIFEDICSLIVCSEEMCANIPFKIGESNFWTSKSDYWSPSLYDIVCTDLKDKALKLSSLQKKRGLN